MVGIFFDAIDPNGEPHSAHFWAENAEMCFKILTELIGVGWQLSHVDLVCGNYRISLPIEVFDGEDMYVPIKKLRKEWETLLS